MRNFSTSVDLSNSFTIGVNVSFAGQYFVDCQHAIIITMDANPECLSSSEEAVLEDFTRWFLRAKEDDQNGLYPQKPVFLYANLNTGHTVVFVVTNDRGAPALACA